MNPTKRKILDTACRLFNENGVSETSLRTIADDMGISIGNLQYHFKKRDDVIETLYFEIVDKMDAVFQPAQHSLLASVLNFPKITIEVLFEYRFFLIDLVTITRNNQKIKKHFSDLSKLRTSQFLEITQILISKGIMRNEAFEGEYESLYQRIEVISNFWFSSQLIHTNKITRAMVDDYCKVINHAIYPYFTDEAKHDNEGAEKMS